MTQPPRSADQEGTGQDSRDKQPASSTTGPNGSSETRSAIITVSAIIGALGVFAGIFALFSPLFSEKGLSRGVTAALIVFGVGVGMIALALLLEALPRLRPAQRDPYPPGRPPVLVVRATVLAVAAGVGVLLMAGAAVWLVAFTPPAAPEGNISYPANGANVPQNVEVSGMAKNIPAGHRIWILVDVGGLYHPYRSPGTEGDFPFLMLVTLGGPNDGGTTFRLHLIEADPEGNARLNAVKAGPGVRPEALDYRHVKFLTTVAVQRA